MQEVISPHYFYLTKAAMKMGASDTSSAAFTVYVVKPAKQWKIVHQFCIVHTREHHL